MVDLLSSNCIELVDNGLNSSRIKPLSALAEVFSDSIPAGSIKQILDLLTQHVRNAAEVKGLQTPSGSAFSNSRGFWFEVIVAAHAWNYRLMRGLTDYFIIKMPNLKTFDFRRIFDEQTDNMLRELELSFPEGVRLLSASPDLIIIQQKNLLTDSDDQLLNLSEQNVLRLTRSYNEISGKCKWSAVKAGIGLTTSMRPDRRLQLIYEGNMLKSVFAHLNIRHWDNKVNFDYYGASGEKLSNADKEALQTAATHTIVDVNATPSRAVDEIYSLHDTDHIYTMLDEIMEREFSA